MEETTTTATSMPSSTGGRKRRYENINGDDITRAKAKVAQLKSRRDRSRYAKQSRNYVKTFFDFLITFGYTACMIQGRRQYGNITAAMFAQFTTTITRTANDGTEVMLKQSSYSKYKTALYNEMREGYMGDPIEPSRQLQDGISKHLKLIGLDNSYDGERGVVKITEGNPAWDFKFFKNLCKFLYERGRVKDIWCLCILLLAFNLISRINRIFKIRLSHMRMKGDAWFVVYPKSKTDPTGNFKTPKHLYYNNEVAYLSMPFVLGIYLLTHDLDDGDLLFTKAATKQPEDEDEKPSADTNRLMKYIRTSVFEVRINEDGKKVVTNQYWANFFSENSIDWEEITSHGIRKLAKSYASTGSMANTDTDAVEIRMAHSVNKTHKKHSGMSGVNGTYSNYMEKPDQFIGRVMTLVSVSKLALFCQSPPHFTPEFSNDRLEQAYTYLYNRGESSNTSSLSVTHEREVNNLVTTSTTLPQATVATQINNNKKKMLKFFLAAVVHGLKSNVVPIHGDHIIQRVLGKIPMDEEVVVVPGEDFEEGFTGISGLVDALRIIMNKLDNIYETLSNLGSNVVAPAVNAAMEKYQFIQGGVTEDKLHEVLNTFKNDMLAGIRNAGVTVSSDTDTTITSNISNLSDLKKTFTWEKDYVPPYKRKRHGGKERNLPWGYKLVQTNIKTAIELWDFGTKIMGENVSITHSIIPFSKLDGSDFSHKVVRRKFYRYVAVMNYLSSKVPSNKTLTECYETHVVPHLQKVVNEQDRTYQSVATRRIKVEQWYRYLILREFRKRRRNAHK